MAYICPACRRAGKTEPSVSAYVTGEGLEDPPAPPPETVEDTDAFEDRSDGPGPRFLRGESCPWRVADLPDRLRPYGYRLADQDGGDGETWLAPWADHEETLLEAIRVTFEATVIP
jgi:hypothetical protein